MSAQEIYVVTTPRVKSTGSMSWGFMTGPGVPHEVMQFCRTWGLVTLKPKGKGEFNPWPDTGTAPAVDRKKLKMWDLFLFNDNGGNVLTVAVEESPPNEEGLAHALTENMSKHPGVALLMERKVFDRFEPLCKSLGMTVRVHHHPKQLSTS